MGGRSGVGRWAVVLVLLVGVAWWTGHSLHFENDPLRLLPPDVPEVAAWVQALELFGQADLVIVDVADEKEPFSPAAAEAAARLEEMVARRGLGEVVLGRFSLDVLERVRSLLCRHRADLFGPAIAAEVARAVELEAIRARVQEFRRSLALIPDPTAVARFREDPLGLDEIYLRLLPRPAEVGSEVVVEDGWVWTRDGRHLLLLVSPAPTAGAARLMHGIEEVIERAAGEERGEVRIAYFCKQRAAVENEALVRRDVRRSLLVSLGLVGLLLAAGLPRQALVPAVFSAPAVGLAAGLGTASAAFGRVSPIVAASGAILVGLSVDYAVHLLRETAHRGSRRAALAGVGWPVMLAAGTTAAAFSALLLSVLPGHRQLGTICAVGVLAAAAYSLLAFPSLVAAAVPAGREAPLDRWLAARGARRLSRRAAWGLLAAITVAAAPGWAGLRVESGLARFNAMSRAARADLERIRDAWGMGTDAATLYLARPGADEALAAAEKVESWLRERGGGLGVEGVRGITGFLPSRATQRENRRRWRLFWNRDRLAEVRAVLEDALREAGFVPGFLGDRWRESLLREVPPLGVEDLEAAGLSWLVRQWVVPEGGRWWVRVMLRERVPGGLARAGEAVARIVPGVALASGRRAVERVTSLATGELARVGAHAVAFVLLVLLVAVRRPGPLLAMMAVLLLTLGWTLGAMGWLGVRLTLANSIFAVFVFGLAIDYAVFLLPWRDGRVERHRETGVAVCGATTLAGFGALLLAHHPVLRDVGTTAVLAIGSGLVVAWLVAQAGRGTGRGDDA